MWKKLKTLFAKFFGCSEKLPVQPVEPVVLQEIEQPPIIEDLPPEPMIKQLKKKRQKKA
jgi:hypothetical protein